jgi:hypothetical protein
VAAFHRKTRGIVVLYRCPLKPVKREVPPNRKKRLLRVALARRTDSKIGEQTTKVVRFFAMARRPDREKYELLSENDQPCTSQRDCSSGLLRAGIPGLPSCLQPPSEPAADADLGASVEAVVEVALISEKRIANESCRCPSS